MQLYKKYKEFKINIKMILYFLNKYGIRQMNLLSEFGQKYKNTEIIEFCCATSDHSFGNRGKSTTINTGTCFMCAAQGAAVLSTRGLQGKTSEN